MTRKIYRQAGAVALVLSLSALPLAAQPALAAPQDGFFSTFVHRMLAALPWLGGIVTDTMAGGPDAVTARDSTTSTTDTTSTTPTTATTTTTTTTDTSGGDRGADIDPTS